MMEKSNKVNEQIAKLGSDMIMSAAHTEQETVKQVENLRDAQDVANAAVAGSAAKVDLRQFRKTRPWVRDAKIRRNDPCPCGSGKKYKNCCLASGEYEGYHKV